MTADNAIAGPTNALLACVGAGLRFPSRAGGFAVLQDVNLAIRPHERVAMVGANGSGKSSLLRLLHGLVQPTQGCVRRGTGYPNDGRSGDDPGAAPAAAPRLAMVFQRPHMLRMTVRRHVALGLWLGGMRWRTARERALAALERVGLADWADHPARTLSGGQQQRVALAQAWALSPQVLLLDEPTASLDPHAKREVESLMAELARDGITLVFASHNLGQVKRLATRVLYLERGRVLADLPVAEFFDQDRLQAASPEAALFVKGESG